METEKVLCIVAMVIAGLLTLFFALDAVLGLLGRPPSGMVFDVLFIIGGAFVLWQAIDTYRELA